MKHLLTLLLPLILSIAATAQNIVPNFSFEEADSCPTNFNNRSYEYSLGCMGWGQATSSTTDYYNACDTEARSIGLVLPIVGVPNNIWGHQDAYQGNAYTGIAMYVYGIPDYKEYLIATIPKLAIDTIYKVTIAVSLADSSRYAVRGFGILFTTYGSPNQYTDGTLVTTPQIDYTNYGVISDTSHWVILSGTFTADSSYTTMIIGGFENSSNMAVAEYNTNSKVNGPNAAYYYVDAVTVEKLSATGINNVKNNSMVSKISPNPFTGHSNLFFYNPGNENYTLTIFNMQGQKVEEKRDITTDRVTIEQNNLPAGVYYYKLYNINGILANGKMVIV